MKQIKIYHNVDEKGQVTDTFSPLVSPDSYTVSYWLIADYGKTLRHKKSLTKRRSITIPAYQLKDWEEVDIAN